MATAKKIAICVNTAALDQLYTALIMAATACTIADRVDLCVAMGGVTPFVKGKMENLDVAAELTALGAEFKQRIEASNYIKPHELVRQAKESGVCFIHACQPSLDLFGYKRDDLIPEVDDVLGAAAALEIAGNADLVLIY